MILARRNSDRFIKFSPLLAAAGQIDLYSFAVEIPVSANHNQSPHNQLMFRVLSKGGAETAQAVIFAFLTACCVEHVGVETRVFSIHNEQQRVGNLFCYTRKDDNTEHAYRQGDSFGGPSYSAAEAARWKAAYEEETSDFRTTGFAKSRFRQTSGKMRKEVHGANIIALAIYFVRRMGLTSLCASVLRSIAEKQCLESPVPRRPRNGHRRNHRASRAPYRRTASGTSTESFATGR